MDISVAQHIQINHPIRRIFIWGMMGVGKSTLGKSLAHRLEWSHIDLDDFIADQSNQSITEIFDEQGEVEFRVIEAACLKEIIGKNEIVVSVGGGTPHFYDNASIMKEAGLCVWLDAPVAMLLHRIKNGKTERPLLEKLTVTDQSNKLERLLAERTPSYNKAHLIVNVQKLDRTGVTNLIQGIIRGK